MNAINRSYCSYFNLLRTSRWEVSNIVEAFNNGHLSLHIKRTCGSALADGGPISELL